MGWKILTREMVKQLKLGTQLKCIDPNHNLKKDTIYIYSHHLSDEMSYDALCIYVKGINVGFYYNRFAVKDKHGSKMRGESL